jgi:uncharacterized protein (TIGR01777 family)
MGLMTIVVAGGSGFLGSALVDGWRADGHQVLVLTRRPQRRDDVAWSVDGSDTAWTAAIEKADAVVNLAGEGIADKRWTASRKAAILDSRVRATRALVAAIKAARNPPRTLISASAIGYYGDRGDEILTEDSAPGSDFLSQVCRQWEDQALGASEVSRVVLLRTGIVLSRNGGALPQMARPFRFFAGGPVGTGRQYMSWIHLADWVAMARWALTTDAVRGPLNVTGPAPVTNAEFSRTLGQALHRPSIVPAPGIALRLALGEMAGSLLLAGQRVLPTKAQHLGFEFRFKTVDAALQEIYRGGSSPSQAA